jgi:cytochrome c553
VVRDWDKLDTYMILDQKGRTTNYIAIDKVPLNQVDFVVGGQRKQRYATYYDGGPRKEWLATTEDGGISWKLDKSTVHDFPGNKERAGYKFLFIEVRPKDGDLKVCEQCHTRTQASTKGKGANDLRGYRLTERYADFADYTRPAWGKGNRQVSIDGKGRRDHQQDMDMRLCTTIRGPHSVHADMACFDCHDAHNVGNDPVNPRLKVSRIETCAACHGAKAEAVLTALDGRKGWQRAGYPDWRSEYGREANKQHILNLDAQGRAYGVTPAQYHWALKKGGNPKKEADWESIWPWEKADFEAKGLTVAIGAAPWNQ